MNKQTETASCQWGVQLAGHSFDLLDWEAALKPPFGPYVELINDVYILRSSEFDGLQQPSEVLERAELLVEQINGAMAVSRGSRPIRVGNVVQIMPDGTRHDYQMAAAVMEGRSRATAVGAAMRDGVILPSPVPRESEVQRWTAIADVDDRLADALVYFARATWFDLYKAIECLEDWVGSERVLEARGWIETGQLKRVKRTANSFRHRQDGKHTPPSPPVTNQEARLVLATLLRRAFEETALGGP
jgi:hypothetical protein